MSWSRIDKKDNLDAGVVSGTIYPLLERRMSVPAVAVVVLWCSHAALMVVGLTSVWTTVFIETATSPPSALDGKMTKLYTATFWDNVQQFWDADAGAVAVIIVVNGLAQPLGKCVAFLAIAFRPMTTEAREALLSAQEATGKLSITPFYVEAILLMAFAFTFQIGDGLKAKIYIQCYNGLLVFFYASMNANVLVNVLRLLQRACLQEDEALALEGLGRDSGSGGAGDLAAAARAAVAATALANTAAVAAGQGKGEGEGKGGEGGGDAPKGELGAESADAAERQWRRDANRALVVFPCSVACLACFYTIYTKPFIEFFSSGIGARFIVDNGPDLTLSLRDIADGLLTKVHPFFHGASYAFWFYMNLVVVPVALPVLAALDALAALPPHFRRAPIPPAKRQLSGSGGGGDWQARGVGCLRCLPAWLFDAATMDEARTVLRECVQLVAPWSTAESAVVAVFFVVPNMATVSEFVFNATDPCPGLESKTSGLETCITVEATVLAVGGALLLLWCALTVWLTRAVLSGQKGLSRVVLRRTAAAGGGEAGDDEAMFRASLPRGSGSLGAGTAPLLGDLRASGGSGEGGGSGQRLSHRSFSAGSAGVV